MGATKWLDDIVTDLVDIISPTGTEAKAFHADSETFFLLVVVLRADEENESRAADM